MRARRPHFLCTLGRRGRGRAVHRGTIPRRSRPDGARRTFSGRRWFEGAAPQSAELHPDELGLPPSTSAASSRSVSVVLWLCGARRPDGPTTPGIPTKNVTFETRRIHRCPPWRTGPALRCHAGAVRRHAVRIARSRNAGARHSTRHARRLVTSEPGIARMPRAARRRPRPRRPVVNQVRLTDAQADPRAPLLARMRRLP